MTADWPQIDPNAVTSSSDLFGGELFGDELMDMYNSAAVVGSASETMGSIGEIPNLLPTTPGDPSANKEAEMNKAAEVANHPAAAQVAMAPDADDADDGLGAFRPSTSFSDFTHLLGAGDKSTDKQKAGQNTHADCDDPKSRKRMRGPSEATNEPAPSEGSEPPSPKKRAVSESDPNEFETASAACAENGVDPSLPANNPSPAPVASVLPAQVPTTLPEQQLNAEPQTTVNGSSIPTAQLTSNTNPVIQAAPTPALVLGPGLTQMSVPAPEPPSSSPSLGESVVGGTVQPTAAPLPAPLAAPPAAPLPAPSIMTPAPSGAGLTLAPPNIKTELVSPPPVPVGGTGAVPAAPVVTPNPAPLPAPTATSAVVDTRVAQIVPQSSFAQPLAPPHVQPTVASPPVAPTAMAPPTLAPPPVAPPAVAPPSAAQPVVAQPAVAPPTAANSVVVPPVALTKPPVAVAGIQTATAVSRPVMTMQSKVKTAPVAAQPASAARGQTSEADFRDVAQQAVTNLIMNAGAVKAQQSAAPVAAPSKPVSAFSVKTDDTGKKPVDTSSSHIAALTSSNWVAACSASVAGAPPGTQAAAQAAALAAAAAANDPAVVKANRAKRANLTADERARQNRDRNREHARNTRLRKKAYVEELKRTLTELVAQRDAQELEKRHEAQRDLEVREVRFRVMEEFLKLRAQGGNPALLARWVAILEEGFTLTLPKTEYRTMVHRRSRQAQVPVPGNLPRSVSLDNAAASARAAKLQESLLAKEQTFKGAAEVMEDASHLASFLSSLGHGPHVPVVGAAGAVCFSYLCDRKKFMMDGVTAVLEWSATTSGVMSRGIPSDLILKGTMRATFNSASNKLMCAELLFDTGAVSSHLKALMVSPGVAQQTCDAVAAVAAAAQMTASEADALLDSIQMPQLADVPAPAPASLHVMSNPPQVVMTAPNTVTSSAVSVSSNDKGDSSSDESVDDKGTVTIPPGALGTVLTG
eukprot:CAMPEP_0183326546 /NCGR_PEP_ID=MMETSP0160_2-20130417/82456_1 /TAXON_ID=2839 ORGANISM="Odontella Sinensis, Strain Grunow 1884" /NCGR_SAMPLE_ID=MMETSP0160_2 /ASSEMBLY_ACC=CAM_ASM_000250 /LENGTH=978 /DNA_ID=CAMNT_0025494551 /DNA_START=115 /DNA_END=3051 /DNA_ORIENTATION=-